jgi:regulatory protein
MKKLHSDHTSECNYSFLEAKAKLESYCAYQERCVFEVRNKMKTWNLSLEQQDQLISDLISNRFLDEERFAEAFVSGKFRIKKWGRIKIRTHLKSKFISNYSLNKAIASIDGDTYFQTLIDVLESKNRLLANGLSTWDKKVKLIRFASSRGFEQDLILDALAIVLKSE